MFRWFYKALLDQLEKEAKRKIDELGTNLPPAEDYLSNHNLDKRISDQASKIEAICEHLKIYLDYPRSEYTVRQRYGGTQEASSQIAKKGIK